MEEKKWQGMTNAEHLADCEKLEQKRKEPTLTGDKVHDLFMSLLYTADEVAGGPPTDFVPVEGITKKIGFHPGRLEAARDKIKGMLDELPDEFKQSGGGGMSFLNMCMDRHGNQWTGFHAIQEELCLMGMGHGLITFPLDRGMWSVLPGGVPYVMYMDK